MLAACLWASATFAQTFPVGRNSTVIIDEARGNRQIPVEIFYPATSAGVNTPVASGGPGYPVVVFGHGFLISVSSYNWLGDSLARNGFIAVLPASEGGLLPSHGEFGADLLVVSRKILLWNSDQASAFFGRVAQRSAVGGHSMGGGSSFLAASVADAGIKALFNFAAAETNPSAINAASLVSIPSLIFSGSRDCIVPPATQFSMYQNIPPSNCKYYVNITDALHCQFANNNFTCATGQVFTGCNSSPISLTSLYNSVSGLLIPFLNLHLKEQCVEGERFRVLFTNFSATSKSSECPPSPGCGVVPVKLNYFTGVFRDGKNSLEWQTQDEINFSHFEVYKGSNSDDLSPLHLGRVEAAGGSSALRYNFVDHDPLAPQTFYRLKMTDRDGGLSWSPVLRLLSKEMNENEILIYPNPVRSYFSIYNDGLNKWVAADVFDHSGRKIQVSKRESAGEFKIDVSSLSTGAYYLRLRGLDGKNRLSKFLKD